MHTVYALFVGIDDYPEQPLRGCVNDVRAAEEWLRRSGLPVRSRRLYDAEATRAAVRAGIEEHLSGGGPGDTALLWFSGHGSEEDTDDPRASTGRSRSLVCHDSLRPGGQPLLRDTELGALLDRIAARGVHVLAVLDCCHSGGATRDVAPGAVARGVEWRPWWRTEGACGGGGARDGGGQGPAPSRHVLLAACRPHERAYEDVVYGEVRGCFSHAVLATLDRLGPGATYGAVHALTEERVNSRMPWQHPELRGPEDGRFLRGDSAMASPFLLRHTAAGWEVNCGRAHGLRATGAEFTVRGARGDGPGTVVVRTLRAESALVEPVGRRPGAVGTDRVYEVTPSALAFPPVAVSLMGEPAAVKPLERMIADAPLLTLSGTERDGDPLRTVVNSGHAHVSGGGGRSIPPLPLRTPEDARRVVDCLTHVARWQHLRDLANPDPWLSSLVRVTVRETPVGRVRYTAEGPIVCSYTPEGAPPQVRVSIHNDTGHELWCVLLDLTDSYGSSPHLFDGDFVGPGRAGLARAGEPVWLTLPPGRSVVSGAFTRDWLKVVVAENELNLAPFRLPRWSYDSASASRDGTPGTGSGSGLLRLTAPPADGARDAGGPAPEPGRWGTAQVLLHTEVP
ncbi:caspase family protein [Streptomyces clavuligerus]|uniref:Caspase domain protein n=2 Tax=Streptomyces clavuligerus TaxID=1901 RepID=D5SKU1_STRCL|nr:caspase family protein [Streptomyces clavuligerus]ANW22427.1 caspase [Streptomyces clavuligerus]AXU17331.1 caspase family protein [Streptomyces clavuligerus]EFG04534.1 Caspase domain protein [Streptomyces clavuligerus]MBY6307017.1 caspase family protein [Streptomyces clavuligerus]QCS10400.1 caspase family protein [Streptomyces clavuligerus]